MPSPTTSRDEIVLITRVRTLNKGNQALSAAWVAMVQRAFPGTKIRVLERRPRHLLQYTLRQIAEARDPFAAFDALATKLAAMAPGPELAGDSVGSSRIFLDETIPAPQKFGALRQRLNLRGRAAAFGFYADDYRRRLSACQRARLVVVNPAGEFFPREPLAAFYHILDAYVAHKLGRPTAIVNHTMDIDDATLRTLIPKVYRQLSLIGFRDAKSVAAFEKMGGDTSNVLVTPDLALTTIFSGKLARRIGTIGVTINVPEAAAYKYLDQWKAAIAALRAKGFKIELISNEIPADLGFYEQLRAAFPDLTIASAGLDHDRYCELLATYELVVSSRMHTGILAMIAGTPVVPVEGASFKITGLFQELGLATPVIRPNSANWVDLVVNQAVALRTTRDVVVRDVSTRIDSVRDQITSMLVPRLQAAAGSLGEVQ